MVLELNWRLFFFFEPHCHPCRAADLKLHAKELWQENVKCFWSPPWRHPYSINLGAVCSVQTPWLSSTLRHCGTSVWAVYSVPFVCSERRLMWSYDITRTDASRNTLGSFWVWFWINIWSLNTEHPEFFTSHPNIQLQDPYGIMTYGLKIFAPNHLV